MENKSKNKKVEAKTKASTTIKELINQRWNLGIARRKCGGEEENPSTSIRDTIEVIGKIRGQAWSTHNRDVIQGGRDVIVTFEQGDAIGSW